MVGFDIVQHLLTETITRVKQQLLLVALVCADIVSQKADSLAQARRARRFLALSLPKLLRPSRSMACSRLAA